MVILNYGMTVSRILLKRISVRPLSALYPISILPATVRLKLTAYAAVFLAPAANPVIAVRPVSAPRKDVAGKEAHVLWILPAVGRHNEDAGALPFLKGLMAPTRFQIVQIRRPLA